MAKSGVKKEDIKVEPGCGDTSQSNLDDQIKKLVLKKTNVKVELSWDGITIKPTGKKSPLLATSWIIALLHKFPIEEKNEYELHNTSGKPSVLRTKDITFTVWNTTGTLQIQGSNVKQWYEKEFESVLENLPKNMQLPKSDPEDKKKEKNPQCKEEPKDSDQTQSGKD